MAKRLGAGLIGCVVLLACLCAPSPPAEAATTYATLSGALPNNPSSPLVDNTHRRVFEMTGSRLISLRFDLSRSGSAALPPGARTIALPGDDSALFMLTLPGGADAAGRLVRIDPRTLVRTGSWREPGVHDDSNIVFSHGLFWALIQRSTDAAEHQRVVLATLDPRHPGRGWHGRSLAPPPCDSSGQDCFLVAAPRGPWLTVVRGGSPATVDSYRARTDGSVELLSETEVNGFENGPYFSPDGKAAVMDALYHYASSGGFTTVDPPDFSGGEYFPGDSLVSASYTSGSRWIVALDRWGDSEFFDPANPEASPLAGAQIRTDDPTGVLVQPALRPAYPVGQPFFFALVELNIDNSQGSTWKYFLARYPSAPAQG